MEDSDDNAMHPPGQGRLSKKANDAIMQRVSRPSWRSPFYWWLIEHHDELRHSEVNTGCGISWKDICGDLAALGITLVDGRPVKPATAKRNWQRVRKEIVRVEERRARELAEREARRAADPRRNMPSRFGKSAVVGPPLSDVQPRPQPQAAPSSSRQLVPVGPSRLPTPVSTSSGTSENGDEPWRNMELPQVLAHIQLPDWDGQILDLRQFFRDDGVPEPWEDPGLSDIERIGSMRAQIWSRAKEWARYKPHERRFMKKW